MKNSHATDARDSPKSEPGGREFLILSVSSRRQLNSGGFSGVQNQCNQNVQIRGFSFNAAVLECYFSAKF